jgi:hypothetical protein
LETIDRVSLALGGESIYKVAFELIPKFLSNKDNWLYKHTGLMAISQTAEGCSDEYMEQLGKLVE